MLQAIPFEFCLEENYSIDMYLGRSVDYTI